MAATTTKVIQELRLHLCPKGTESNGLRKLISTGYPSSIQSLRNTGTSILVRESTGARARIIAQTYFPPASNPGRHGSTVEEVKVEVDGLDSKQIVAALEKAGIISSK